MMVKLVTFSRKGKRKEFVIGTAPSIIGRKPEVDIRIPLGEVSRAHCEIRVNGDKVIVRDLDSSNGTYVNNERVTETPLKAGDTMRVGPVHFTVQIDGKPEKIVPLPGSRPASSRPVASDAKTQAGPAKPPAPAESPSDDDFDIDNLEELDSEDLSDLDLVHADIDEISDSGIIDEVDEVEEIEGLEEISEDDLIPDDDSDKV